MGPLIAILFSFTHSPHVPRFIRHEEAHDMPRLKTCHVSGHLMAQHDGLTKAAMNVYYQHMRHMCQMWPRTCRRKCGPPFKLPSATSELRDGNGSVIDDPRLIFYRHASHSSTSSATPALASKWPSSRKSMNFPSSSLCQQSRSSLLLPVPRP